MSKIETVLGIKFFVGSEVEAIEQVRKGGLILAPSGPGLSVDLVKQPSYRESLLNADMNITDSGAMVLTWKMFKFRSLPRLSGLKYLQLILAMPELKEPGSVFWVMPTKAESDRNLKWFGENGYPVVQDDVYLAPKYGTGELIDLELEAILEKRKPRVVMMAIGGGVQERLGYSLRRRLSYKPAILCLGAAIAFITGGQANIPPWADRLMLGWLFRILYSPSKFFPRYWDARRLFPLMWKYGSSLPPLQTHIESK